MSYTFAFACYAMMVLAKQMGVGVSSCFGINGGSSGNIVVALSGKPGFCSVRPRISCISSLMTVCETSQRANFLWCLPWMEISSASVSGIRACAVSVSRRSSGVTSSFCHLFCRSGCGGRSIRTMDPDLKSCGYIWLRSSHHFLPCRKPGI